jgi:hypothetical protein
MCAARSNVAPPHAHRAVLSRTPLLRFLSPSALAGPRCVVPGRPAQEPSRFGVRSPRVRPARPRTFALWCRPCGFSPPRMRCGASSMPDSSLASFANRIRSPDEQSARKSNASSITRAGAARRIRVWRAHGSIRHIKRHRFVSSVAWPGHAPSRSLARCSATVGFRLSRPGRASRPSLLARRRSWGSISALRRVDPAER